jgi:hypothetical protein
MNQFYRIISAGLVFSTLMACGPRIHKNTLVRIGGESISHYWEMFQTTVQQDTVYLETTDARLISKFNVRNFNLSADLRTTDGAEGLLDFHISDPESQTLQGYSVVINNTDYRKGNPQKSGSLSRIRNNYVRTVTDDNWYNLRVEVRGNHIRTWVNEKIISEYFQPDNPFRLDDLTGRVLSEGRIVFRKMNADGQIAIGDIRFEAFDDKLPAETDTIPAQESADDMLTLLNQQNFPVIDYHGHLKGGLTMGEICRHGRTFGYNYGISPNCGLNFPVTNDSSLNAYYHEIAGEPVFKAMQCEGREWITLFTPAIIEQYDYIFTDAMTWTDHKGRRMRLWIPEETFVDDEQQFMNMLVGKIEAVLSQEPVDIYVNPTYLPASLADSYDRLWTVERMDRVIRALVENDVALEINSRFKIPSVAFVKKAKAAGVKFTMGTNNGSNDDLGRLEYTLEVIREAGISAEDIFLPRPRGDKKIASMGLPAKITG